MEQLPADIHIEQAGAIIENSSIQANQVAGRDIYNYAPSDPLFVQVHLDYFGSANYLVPKFSEAAYDQLMKEHILIVHGWQAFDKGSFLRHLAFKAHRTTEYQTQELEINEENDSLYHQINKNTTQCIYLLDRLHPQHIDYDLPRLQSLATSKSIYIIISTDLSLEAWQLNVTDKAQYTFKIPENDIYNSVDLTTFLYQKLREADLLPDKDAVTSLTKDTALLGMSLKPLATKLANPENLNLFVLRLKNESHLSKALILQIVDSIVSSEEGVVKKWFMTLSHKEKLIALGAVLLEGAYDDQFFSIMGQVVDKMWKHSDKSLQALDYRDLDFLSDFFRFENLGAGRQVLHTRYPHQKIEIIKGSWHLYRRHLLSIIPVFFETAINSLNTHSSDWENFGTRQKRANLRMVIGHTVSEIGLVSTFSIENTLIAFAAHPDDRVKRIAAKSLARWREFEADEKLFELLRSWLEDERPQKIISEYLAKREGWQQTAAYQDRALSYLRASAIHALSYSTNYDSPNQLHERIITLLVNLVNQPRNPLINDALKSAIPRLVHHHILQLKDILLEEFMKYDDMATPVANGLLRAYKDYPKDLRVTLNRWFEECLEDNSKLNRRKKFTHRDKVLITLLELYGQLNFKEYHPVISLEEVYTKLAQLSKTEKRRSVRDAIFKTMGKLLRWDWVSWENRIPMIWNDHDFEDAEPLVDSLFSVFLNARKNLKDTPYSFQWRGENYPLWLNMNERPKTILEMKLGNWIRSDHDSHKKLALLSFLKIAKTFEIDEKASVIVVQQKALSQNQHTPDSNKPEAQPVMPEQPIAFSLSFLTRIKIFFLLFFRPKTDIGTLKILLITLYKYRYFNRDYRKHLRIVLQKWASMENSWLQKFSRWLRRLF